MHPFNQLIISDGELVSTLRLIHMERGFEPLADHVTLSECGIEADGSVLSLLIEEAGTVRISVLFQKLTISIY